ncbi:MAG: hypothetical protein LBF40_08545 [Deltaproteobacteria bacterium]|jgi:hypothetical protein|nr:hypothetical protein [Deltaproteobacteria bacterium]
MQNATILATLAIAVALAMLAPQALLAQGLEKPAAPGDPFVKGDHMTEFKLPSAAKTDSGTFKGFDYEKSSKSFDRLVIKNDAKPYTQYQKDRAFDGSGAAYDREFGGRDAMKEFKKIEADMLNHQPKQQ